MRANKMNRICHTIILLGLIIFPSCGAIPPEKQKTNLVESIPTTSTEAMSFATRAPSVQSSSPIVKATTPTAMTPKIPYTLTVIPSDVVPATHVAMMLQVPVPGWLIFLGVPAGAGWPEGIWVIRENGIGKRNILDEKGKPWEHPEMPSWSPDGQWISFVASPPLAPYPSNGKDEIYISRADGSEIRRMTNTPGYKTAKSWSPDGKSIIYSQTIDGENDQTEVDLFEVEINTGRIHQITHTPSIFEHSPSYSPMGDSIAYTSVSLDQKPVTFNLMILDMDNGYSKQLMVTKMNVDEIAWSPDGQQIVFSSSSYNTFDLKECDEDLYIVNRDGSDLRRLTDYPGSVRSPTWSPDGQWIVFETSRICGSGGQWQINLIKVDGGWVNEVGSSSSLQMNPAFPPVPDWSPLPALQIGKIFSITASGAQLKLRASPSTTGDVLDKLNKGDRILVLEGPTVAEEYLWWRVRLNDSGREGWVAENPGWFAGSDSNLP